MSIAKDTTVRFRIDGKKVFGVVRTEATATATGPVVSVQLLPDFSHLTPTGWTDANATELVPVKVCACAHLAYRPIYGDHKGELFTTGCDFTRMPSRSSKFLPGHDAKAKGFLIKASGECQEMENGKGALTNAIELGDKIAAKVAEGIENARKKMVGPRKVRSPRPAAGPAKAQTEAEELTEQQRLIRDLKLTDPMLRMVVTAALDEHAGFRGYVTGSTGTQVALLNRKLTSYGALTDLGWKVADQPTLAEAHPELVQCKDDQGAYERHTRGASDASETGWACKRCGTEMQDN